MVCRPGTGGRPRVPLAKAAENPAPTLHDLHPLSASATNDPAFLLRKPGGWSFHELNVPLEERVNFTRDGPDLSDDFFIRAQALHTPRTGGAAPLRLAFRWLPEAGVQPYGLQRPGTAYPK
jgi:hypothetical protein